MGNPKTQKKKNKGQEKSTEDVKPQNTDKKSAQEKEKPAPRKQEDKTKEKNQSNTSQAEKQASKDSKSQASAPASTVPTTISAHTTVPKVRKVDGVIIKDVEREDADDDTELIEEEVVNAKEIEKT